jgi:hypothetical protein
VHPAGDRPPAASWLYDDLLAWISPGGLLLTAMMLRFPAGLQLLRAQAPELVLPTWLAGAYAIGLTLSPIGRLVYGAAQAYVWYRLRDAWTPAIAFLADRLHHTEGLDLPAASQMSASLFHDADRRLREYLEAVDPSARAVGHRMKILCNLACNAGAACLVFMAIDAAAGNAVTWTPPQISVGFLCTLLAFIAAAYRERRRQRTQLSLWRRTRVLGGVGDQVAR